LKTLRRFVESKALVFVLCLLPLAWIAFDAWRGQLTADPIKEVEHRTGDWTLRLLLTTLAITPLVGLSGWNWPRHARRMLGLFTFFYGCAHLSIYVLLDQGLVTGDLVWAELVKDVLKRKYITVGFSAFLLMIPLAATSSNRAIRKMGPDRWRLLHRLVYVSALGGVVHYYWLVKASHVRPLTYAAVFVLLMAYRPLEKVRRARAAKRKAAAAAAGGAGAV
jgi:sulfoxide reductase heme-binding subunit YedZ